MNTKAESHRKEAAMRKLMRVDLTNGKCAEEAIPQSVAEGFVGGRGFGAKYVYDEIAPGTDPLGPDNRMYFVVGAMAGTGAQSMSKWMVFTKSPLTGTYTRSSGGGDFGAHLKWSGYEILAIEGKASRPCYVLLKDGKCEVLDAAGIWGKATSECEQALQGKHGSRAQVVCVGPAAEKGVRYAGLFTVGRAAGRGGTGAVMASKNLKAIVIEANRREDVARPDRFKELVQQQIKAYQEGLGFEPFRDFGTPMGVAVNNSMGVFPVRNFREGFLEGNEQVGFDKYAAITEKHEGCYSCMLRCGKLRTLSTGEYAGTQTMGPHYETIWAFTGPTACTDFEATLVADRLCYDFGLDSISTGNTIGFAYELFEKGILSAKDTGGLALEWGDPRPMLKLVEMIGKREGIGELLGEGVRRAAEKLGQGAEQYAMHVKGQELPGYEPRAMKALGMNFATSNVGANHCYGYAGQELGNPRPRVVDGAADEDKGDIVKYNQDYTATLELVNACTFPGNNLDFFGPELLVEMLVAVLDEDKFGSADYLSLVAEKTYNIERCFNVREGFSRKDDRLPKRMYTEQLKGGVREGEYYRTPDKIIDEYYESRGWDSEGIPTEATLDRLGLSDIGRDIARFRK